MIYASQKTVVRLAFALGAFALMALFAVPDRAPRSSADDGVQPVSTPAALAAGESVSDDKGAVLGASQTPSGGGKPLLDGDDDISPAILGGAKGAQVYPNLAASLDGVAAASGEGAGLTAIADAAVDSPPSDDASSTAVSVYAASDISDAKSFLERHGVSVDYFGDTWLEASVPARLLGALSERADVIRVEKIIPAVSDRAPSTSASPTPEPCRYNLGTFDVRSLGALGARNIGRSSERSGTWSESACPGSRKNRYARFYTFTLNARANVTLYLATPDATETTEKVVPEMFLRSGLNVLGAYIDRDRGRPRHRNPWEHDAYLHMPLDAGTYTVEAATRHREKTGSYTLTTSYSAAQDNCLATSLGTLATASPQKSVNGAAWPSDCFSTSKTNSQAAYYTFNLPEAAAVEINLSSSASGADPFLYLRRGARTHGASFASDDDGGTGNGAYIYRELAAGTYTIEAASQTAGATGTYNLSATIPISSDCLSNLGTLAADREIEGSWTSGCESATRAGSYARYYSFSLSSPAFVEVELESSAESDDAAKSPRHVSTYPVLRAGAGARTGPAIGLRQDDPSATSLTPVDGVAKGYDDSLWRKASMVSRLLTAGDYTVEASTVFPRRVGDFTLTLSPTFAAPCAAAPLTLTDGAETSPADQSWTSGCDSARIIGARAKHYTFTLAAPKTVKIELDSSDAYTRLYLTRGEDAAGTEFIDDDPPARTGAQPRGRRIEFSRWDIALGALPTRDSRIERILGAGTYTIEAAAAKMSADTGAFTLKITPSAITPLAVDASSVCAKDLGEVSTTTDVSDSWEWTPCVDWASQVDNYYTFTLAAPAVVDMAMFPHALYSAPGSLEPADAARFYSSPYAFAVGALHLYRERDGYVAGADRWRHLGSAYDYRSAVRYSAALEAGTYLVSTLPRPIDKTGGFGFRLRGSVPPPTCSASAIGELTSGSTARPGTWASDCDSERRPGSRARKYSFTLAHDSGVTIELDTAAPDAPKVNPYLYLTAATSTAPVIAEDDGGGDGSAARIKTTLKASTIYVVEATTDDIGRTGAFTLTIDVAPIAPPACETENMGAIRGRATRTGTWSEGCVPDSAAWNDAEPSEIPASSRSYAFTLAKRSFVTLDASGPGADTVIALRKPSDGPGIFDFDNDSGIGRRASIRRFLDAGDYVAEIGELPPTPAADSFTFAVSAAPVERVYPSPDCEIALGTIGRVPGSVAIADIWGRASCRSANLVVDHRGQMGYAIRYSFTLDKPARVNMSIDAGREAHLYLKRVGETENAAHLTVGQRRPNWFGHLNLPAGSYEVEAAAALRAIDRSGALPRAGVYVFVISVDEATGDVPTVVNSDEWNALGHTGAGVKVGVIDAGFRRYSALGVEVPAPAGEKCEPDEPTDCLSAVDERASNRPSLQGTAVAEAIHDIAPDADLYLAAASSRGELSEAVDWMTAQGVDVVNMSLSWPWDGPPDGSSPYENGVGVLIDKAVRGGAAWVNSAGDRGRFAWSGEYADADGDGLIEFAPGDETNSFAGLASLTLEIRWDDDWRGADTDLDLYVLDSLNRVVASSRDYQSGLAGHVPYESVKIQARSGVAYRVAIHHASGPAPAWVQMRDYTGFEGRYRDFSFEHAGAGSVSHPADGDNPGMLAVGAAAWHDMSELRPYSGRGTTADGRAKPDVVAADGEMSIAYGAEFASTGQAAAHTAGMAALLKGRYPDMSPHQIAQYLKDQASPRPETPDGSLTVPNSAWGYGVARMPDSPIEISGGQRLRVSDTPDAGDALGYSVAMSADGNAAVAGAPTHDGGGSSAGAAFVFVKGEEYWAKAAKLTSPDAAANNRFGESVSISSDGGFVIVGSPGSATGRGAAYVFKKPAAGWADTSAAAAKLTARDGWNLDQFGISVSMSADGASVVIGARGDDSEKGAAYVFTKPAAGWRDSSGAAKLAAADGAAGGLFGDSVSISGDGLTVVAGAPGHDDGEGAAYLFAKPGAWWGRALISSSTKLTDADGKPGARFGDSVSASANGGVIAVGAPANAYEKGAAHVFVKPPGGWASEASSIELTASDGEYGGAFGGAFGTAVSVSGDGAKVLVGALKNGGDLSAAYLFAKQTDGWALMSTDGSLSGDRTRTRRASNQSSLSTRYGWAVSLNSDGSKLAIGAPGQYVSNTRTDRVSTGGLYVYEESGTTEAGPHFTSGGNGDRFGRSVSVSEDMSAIVVGAHYRDENGNDSGAVYVFGKPTVGWTSATSTPAKLTASDGAWRDRFGISVDVSDDGGVIVVGAPGSNKGAAYVFTKPPAGWGTGAITAAAKLTASDGATNDYYGYSVAVSGDGSVIVVGAVGADNNGAAYVFVKPAVGGWGTSPLTESSKLTASDGALIDRFGYSVSVSADGDVVAVGAPYHDSSATPGAPIVANGKGAVYVFAKPTRGWANVAKLTVADGVRNQRLGTSVSISADGGAVAAGAPGHVDDGAAYIFTKPDTGWASTSSSAAKIAPHDGELHDRFGASVSLSADGGLAVVGSPRDNFYDSIVGSAYAFAKPEGGWASGVAGVKIIAPGANAVSSEFGAAAALGGDVIAIGAPGEDWHTGRAYAFAVGTVERRAPPPTLTVTGPVAIVNEGGEAEFPVDMAPESDETVSVEYRVSSGSADSATPGADYESASGALVFAPGETRKTVRVEVKTDAESESTETFSLHLHAATGARIDSASASATAAIANRDTPVLAVSRTALAFSLEADDPASPTQTLSFDVWNAGVGSAAFSVSSDADWLTVSPASETSAGAADRKTVSATASAAGLSAGEYAAAITISADGVTDAVARAVLTVTPSQQPAAPAASDAPASTDGGSGSGGGSSGGGGGGGGGARRAPDPVIAFAPSALSFIASAGGEDTAFTRRIEVWNAERGDMGFGVSSSASWLSFSPRREQSAGPGDRITVSVTANTANLEPGAHSAAITITQLSGEEESATLQVTLTITGADSTRMAVSPEFSATVESPDAAIRLYLPPGAASGRQEIQLRKLSAADFTAPAENERITLAVDLSAYRIGGTNPIAASYPDGVDLRFALPTGEETACEDGMVRLYRVSGTAWTLLDHRCETDAAGASWAITTLTGFSEYAMTLAETAATPTPTPEPTAIPTPTPEPSPTPEPTPESTPAVAPVSSPTFTPTPENTPMPTAAPVATPTYAPTPENIPTPTSTPSPVLTPTAMPSPSPTAAPVSTPTFAPTPENTPTPTAALVATPTSTPTPEIVPTQTQTPSRTAAPARVAMASQISSAAVDDTPVSQTRPTSVESIGETADDESGSAPVGLAIGLGAGAALALGAAALALIRRRRKNGGGV